MLSKNDTIALVHVTAGTIELIMAILGFVIVAGGLAGLSYRVNRSQANVTQYRDAADAWEKKATAQETQIRDLQAKVTALQAQLAAEKEARQVLEGVVTGKSAVEALAREMAMAFSNVVSKNDFLTWQNEVRQMMSTMNEKLDGRQPSSA